MQTPENTNPRELLQQATLVQRATSIGNADVYRARVQNQTALVKTYIDRPAFIRALFGRRALANEFTILGKLDGVPGIPKPLARIGKDTIVVEFIHDSVPLVASRALKPDQYPPPAFFTQLRALVQTLHKTGISHGDIRRMNVLRTPENRPVLIDFATAVSLQGRLKWLRKILFRMFRKADDFAVAKILYTYYPDLLSPRERNRLENPPWYLRIGRFMRKRVYRKLIKQRRWKKRLSKAKTAINSIGKNHSEEVSP